MKQINESYLPKYLVCVTSDNHNKFIRVIPDESNGTFTSEYGRIGAPSFLSKVYPLGKYDLYVWSKVRKGYIDLTNLVKNAVAATSGEDGYKAIADKDVNSLIKALRKYASDTIKQNYTISLNAITLEMLDKAKTLIDKLNRIVDNIKPTNGNAKYLFNDVLLELFKTIPRKMNRVNEYLLDINNGDAAAKIVDREQKLYDVLLANFLTLQATAASSNKDGKSDGAPTETILEKFGLECELVTDLSKIDEIKSHLGLVASKFKRAFAIVNKKTQDKYIAFMNSNPGCKTKLFFHGSKNENFWNILKNGLLLNPKAAVTGKMLGSGLYFANKAVKSINYTSLQGSYWSGGTSKIGYMAVFAVAVDPHKCYNVTTSSEISTCYGMTWNKLLKILPGATYVYAHKGSYLKEDEVCIYREDQCTIRYLIELAI